MNIWTSPNVELLQTAQKVAEFHRLTAKKDTQTSITEAQILKYVQINF